MTLEDCNALLETARMIDAGELDRDQAALQITAMFEETEVMPSA